MNALESCITEMSGVSVLLKMIDDTFIFGRIGEPDSKAWNELELAIDLLRTQFDARYENLRRTFYGGKCNE